jgi:hypothetical protein
MYTFDGDAISWTPRLTATSVLESIHGENLYPLICTSSLSA